MASGLLLFDGEQQLYGMVPLWQIKYCDGAGLIEKVAMCKKSLYKLTMRYCSDKACNNFAL